MIDLTIKANVEKAHKMFCTLRELYPSVSNQTELFLKARADKIINEEERKFLLQYCN